MRPLALLRRAFAWKSGGLALLSLLAPAVSALAQEGHSAATGSTTDPVSQGIVAVVVISVFVLLSVEAAHRVLVAMSAVALLFAVSYFTPYRLITFEAVPSVLDINVLVLLASMMAVVGVLKTTGVFEWAVGHLMRLAGQRPLVLLAFVGWFTALMSAFLDNVTTVIFVTPMVIGMARQLRLNAAIFLLPMVAASNIGGTATLIGDPPNIMIGSGAGLSFLDFLEDLTLPCVLMIFWSEWYSRRYFRTEFAAFRAQLTGPEAQEPGLTNPRLAKWLGVICAFILLGFLTHHATGMPPAVPALMGAAAALAVQDWLYLRTARPTAHERIHGILHVTEREIEWPTLSFFGFLFIVVGAAVQTGLISTLAEGLQSTIENSSSALGLGANGTLLLAALLIAWVSGLLSALIDNIPFVAVAIPIVARLIPTMQGSNADVLWWALALGACLGGNGTVIGASANVTAVGLAEKDGVRISFAQFARYAAPLTVGTLVIASGYLALHIFLGKMGSFVAMAAVVTVVAAWRILSGRRTPQSDPAVA
jgi:Na+/H+ antiporter NhaD/arsenite permease-like protein